MKSLTVNIATRGRPHLLKKMLEGTLPNMWLPTTRVMVSVDEDDLPTVTSLESLPKESRLHISVKEREDSRGEKYDRALKEMPADVYLLATDHGPILTPGFDEKILEAARIWPDGIGVVYTRMCDELVPMLQAPTAKYVELIGYTYNHDYPYWFIDHEMADISWQIGRINFADVHVDQRDRPNQTIRMHDLEFWCTYYDFTALERRSKARKIIMSPEFQAPDWLKQQLCNWYPLTEMRSIARNNRVRSGAKACEQARGEQSAPDEGYLRAKKRAETKMMELYTALRAAA